MTTTQKKNKGYSQRGLGRGLDALFGDDEPRGQRSEGATTGASKGGLRTLPIENISPNPDQPRGHFEEDALNELASSIREHGILQPILVRQPEEGSETYEIVAGERRWRAAQLAGLHEMPVVIKEFNDEKTYQVALIENLQRKDLNPIEEAKGYEKLIVTYDYKPEEVGKLLGKSRSHIANMVRLLGLPPSLQVMVEVGDLTMGHARALLNAPDAEKLALYVVEKNLSVRETEKLVMQATGQAARDKAAPDKQRRKAGYAEKDADLLALEKDLTDRLGLQVTIDTKEPAGPGTLKIDYKDLDQLDRLLEKLAG